MPDVLVALLRLKPLDDLLDLLTLVAMRDQYGVLGFNDHQILDPHGRDQTMVGLHQAIAGREGHHVAVQAVTIGIALPDIPDRRPAAQIVPPGIQRHHYAGRGVLHDGIVDRLVVAKSELLGGDMQEVAVFLSMSQRLAARLENVRTQPLQLRQEARGPEHEHAAVPQILTGRQILLCHLQGRLLAESQQGMPPLPVGAPQWI